MKPHEETWAFDGVENVRADVSDGPQQRLEVRDASVGRLAATAPAMARLLVGLEWGADICIGYDNMTALGCPSCGGLQNDPGTRADFDHHTVGHDPGCVLVAVLRAAGVVE